MSAAKYREHANEMMRCARASRTDDEREQYVKMADAWTSLAEGAEQGLQPEPEPGSDEAC